MSATNNWTINGNLGADPELKYTNGGMAILNLRVAVNDRVKKQGEWQDQTTWVTVTAFGKRAEGITKILSKGSRIAATGRFQFREYEKRDGTMGHSIELIADDVAPVGPRPNSEGGQRRANGGNERVTGAGTGDWRGDDAPMPDADDGFTDDDVPF